jgi:hypothetical protein
MSGNAWTVAALTSQFIRARALGWLPHFIESGAKYHFDAALLMAIGSRETNLRNIIGDGGHGHGLMQIDNRSFPEWCRKGNWRDAREAIRKGAEVLDAKRVRAIAKNIDADNVLRVAIASYNAGDHGIRDYQIHGNPDLRTTGRDYSHDVLRRASVFRDLLSKAGGSHVAVGKVGAVVPDDGRA